MRNSIRDYKDQWTSDITVAHLAATYSQLKMDKEGYELLGYARDLPPISSESDYCDELVNRATSAVRAVLRNFIARLQIRAILNLLDDVALAAVRARKSRQGHRHRRVPFHPRQWQRVRSRYSSRQANSDFKFQSNTRVRRYFSRLARRRQPKDELALSMPSAVNLTLGPLAYKISWLESQNGNSG